MRGSRIGASLWMHTAKRLVSAQRVSTRPTHADAPVPQQITANGDDGTHHTCTHGLKALRRMGFLPWPESVTGITAGRARLGMAWPGKAGQQSLSPLFGPPRAGFFFGDPP